MGGSYAIHILLSGGSSGICHQKPETSFSGRSRQQNAIIYQRHRRQLGCYHSGDRWDRRSYPHSMPTPSTQSTADFMAKVKANSSKWFRAMHEPTFHWQEGYGAFSVSKSNVDDMIAYIHNQRDHHYHTNAIDEFDALLKKHWDPESLSVRNELKE